MKKVFISSTILLIIGNILITIGEKFFYNKKDIIDLQFNLLNLKNHTDVSSVYPAHLLFTKMMIWIGAFIVVASILFFANLEKKKTIKQVLIGFYMVGCLINVLAIPHPTWFIVAIIPIVIAPFVVTENLLQGILQVGAIHPKNIKNVETQPMNLG